MKRISLVAVSCLAMLALATAAFAEEGKPAEKAENKMGGEKMEHKMAKPAMMSSYMIVSPHTAEECLGMMDEVNKAKELGGWDFGCMAGDHTGYRIVRAKDEAAALAMVPASVRAKAHAQKVMKMTPAMLENAHKHM